MLTHARASARSYGCARIRAHPHVQADYLRRIVSFLGFSARPNLVQVPQENANTFNGKVLQLKCETRGLLQSVFDPWNQRYVWQRCDMI